MSKFFLFLYIRTSKVSQQILVFSCVIVKAWEDFEAENLTLKELLRICARINGPVALN